MNPTHNPQSQIVRRFVIIFGLILIALVTMSVPTAGSPSYDIRLTPTASIPSLPLNDGFESGAEPWRITWHMNDFSRNDQVLCDGENGKPRGNNSNCGFVFRGSARENTSLSQSFNLPAGSAITGDRFNVCLDYKTDSAMLNLNVTLTLTSNTAATLTSKIFSRSFQRTRADYETICSPANVLPQTSTGGEITFRFQGGQGTKVFIDNVSLKRNRPISPTNTPYPTSMTGTFTPTPSGTWPTRTQTPTQTNTPTPTNTFTPSPTGSATFTPEISPTSTPIGGLTPTAGGGGES